jgi:hypothetical protein
MDSDTMLGIHMFGDVQAYEEVEEYQEVTTADPYQNLIELIELSYGDWAYRVLDRFTAQALWSLADEHGAHNALEFIQSQEDFTESL